jgi:flagellar FliJ protein
MYRFRLEPLLKHRKLIEEQLQKEVAVLLKSHATETQKLQNTRNHRDKFLAELQKIQNEGTSVSNIILYVRFIDQLSKAIAKQEKIVLEVLKKFEHKHQDLVEATKKRKILEKLKEKTLRAYKQTMQKKEQDFLNEVGINRYSRGPR